MRTWSASTLISSTSKRPAGADFGLGRVRQTLRGHLLNWVNADAPFPSRRELVPARAETLCRACPPAMGKIPIRDKALAMQGRAGRAGPRVPPAGRTGRTGFAGIGRKE